MSKAIVFSDWHIHDYKNFSNNVNRLQNCLNVLGDLGQFCDEYDIKIILFAGDIFDSHKALLTNVVNETAKAFTTFFTERPDVKFYAITGNHDQSTKNLIEKPAVSALEHLATFFPDNFILIDDIIVEVENEVWVEGVPYYEFPEHFQQRLNEITKKAVKTGGFRYLMIHQTPEGIGNKMIPTDCDPNDVLFRAYNKVFCGHIHKRQQLTKDFHIVGSPIHRDMGDVGEKKGFYVINLQKPEKMKFIYLKGYPEFTEKYEDEVTEEDRNDTNSFLVTKVRLDTLPFIKEAKVEEFSNDLEATELITNFWQEVDGNDKELLKVGLSFIKNNTNEERN